MRFSHPCVKMIIISLIPRLVKRSNVPIDTYLWLEYFELIMVLLSVAHCLSLTTFRAAQALELCIAIIDVIKLYKDLCLI